MAKHENQYESELGDILFEIHRVGIEKDDLVRQLNRDDLTLTLHQQEQLKRMIGACDVKLQIADTRKKYLEKRILEHDNGDSDLQLKPPPLKKKPKR